VYSVAWNDVSHELVTSSWDGTVSIRNISSSATLAIVVPDNQTDHKPQGRWFNVLAVSKSNEKIASADSTGCILVFGAPTWGQVACIKTESIVLDICFLPDVAAENKIVAISFNSQSQQTSISLFACGSAGASPTAAALWTLLIPSFVPYQSNGCGAACCAADGTAAALGGASGASNLAYVIPLNGCACEKPASDTLVSFTNHSAPVSATALCLRGSHLATGDEEGYIRVFDVQTSELVAKISCYDASKEAMPPTFLCLNFSFDAKCIVAGTYSGGIVHCNLETLKYKKMDASAFACEVFDVHALEDGTTVAFCSTNGAQIVDIESQTRRCHCYLKSSSPAHRVRSLRHGTRLVAIAYADGRVDVVDLAERQPTVQDVARFVDDNDEEAILQLLSAYPALVNCTDSSGETPLHRCVTEEKVIILQHMLKSEHSCFVLVDDEHRSVFDLAVQQAHQSITEVLLKVFLPKVPLEQRGSVTSIFHRLVEQNPELVQDVLEALSIAAVETTESCTKVEFPPVSYLVTGCSDLDRPQLWYDFLNEEKAEHANVDKLCSFFKVAGRSFPVSGCVVPLPGIAGPFRNIAHSPLHVIVNMGLHSMLGTATMRAVVDFKWNTFAKWEFLKDAIQFFLYLFLFTVFLLLASTGQEVQLQELYLEGSPAQFRLLLGVIVAIMWGGYFYQELKQMHFYKRSYFHSIWNYADVGALVSALAFFVMHLTRHRSEPAAGACATVFHMMKSISYARAFRGSGPFVRMVFVILQDISTLMLLFVVFTFGFALAFYVVNQQEPESPFQSFQRSLLLTFAMLMGDFELSDFDAGAFSSINFALWGIYMSLVYILFMNMLIALMNNSFSKVIENIDSQWRLEQGKIIMDIERAMPEARDVNNPSSLFPRWVHVLTATGKSSILDATPDTLALQETLHDIEHGQKADSAKILAEMEIREAKLLAYVDKSFLRLKEDLVDTIDGMLSKDHGRERTVSVLDATRLPFHIKPAVGSS
jgi:WD40 repeat protein